MGDGLGETGLANLGDGSEPFLGSGDIFLLQFTVLEGPLDGTLGLGVGDGARVVSVDLLEDLGGFGLGLVEGLHGLLDESGLRDVSVLGNEASGFPGLLLGDVSTLDGSGEAVLEFGVVELAITVGIAPAEDIISSGGGFSLESDGGSGGNKSNEFHVV